MSTSMLVIMLAAAMLLAGCGEQPASPAPAPAPASDDIAIAEPVALFNGQDLTGWEFSGRLNRKKWAVGTAAINPDKKQTLKAEPGGSDLVNTDIVGSDLVTAAHFRDFRLEFEFMLPAEGNSGVYLLGQYEIQVSHEPDADDDMAIGSVPRLIAPLVRVPIEPGRWHKYVIDFLAPRFDTTGAKVKSAKLVRVTIDDTLIHDNVEIPGPTVGALQENVEVRQGPILLQGSHTSVAFRNIILTPKP
jgi:hypothetical protein